MGKLASISLSILILFQSFNIHLEDITSVQVLVEHAQFHKKMYGDSFFEFLADHYGKNMNEHKNDHKEHKDLPFKSDYQNHFHHNIAFTLNHASFAIKPSIYQEVIRNFLYRDSNSTHNIPPIFHPPAVA
ncbi:hypothetical protein [Tenacibaculum sp. IB213877]|uniref:hypothetical protein n=1 Tax=Tenacibaculum sp. IB213877 TaxID=3097351 RepID=UPI002A5ADA6F|nr:hypothetical protein [Tenacibaculum sp. IB213877]MDY0780975.1 hypothetical protein [Tenacibaculum sp. IB213877]